MYIIPQGERQKNVKSCTSNCTSTPWSGLICTWIPSATSRPSVALTCEDNCTGHIHPLWKASLKPQSRQLTAGMDISFSTSAGKLISRNMYSICEVHKDAFVSWLQVLGIVMSSAKLENTIWGKSWSFEMNNEHESVLFPKQNPWLQTLIMAKKL